MSYEKIIIGSPGIIHTRKLRGQILEELLTFFEKRCTTDIGCDACAKTNKHIYAICSMADKYEIGYYLTEHGLVSNKNMIEKVYPVLGVDERNMQQYIFLKKKEESLA